MKGPNAPQADAMEYFGAHVIGEDANGRLMVRFPDPADETQFLTFCLNMRGNPVAPVHPSQIYPIGKGPHPPYRRPSKGTS